MLPDIAIKDFYLQFIHNAKTDADKYKNKLDLTITAKNKCYEYMSDVFARYFEKSPQNSTIF